jgi:hypothetical protein
MNDHPILLVSTEEELKKTDTISYDNCAARI